MMKITIPNKTILENNYRKEFKYGGINLENDDLDVLLKKLKIGNKMEVTLLFPFLDEKERNLTGRISLINKKSFVFAFDNNENSKNINEEILAIIDNNIIQSIYE